MNEKRMLRIEEEIKKELSNIIAFEIKDPRISEFTSIVEVKITNDLDQAKVYVSVLSDDDKKEETIDGLNSAKGFIKMKIGETLRLRKMPEFTFILDETIKKAIYLDQLIKETVAEDERKRREADDRNNREG